MRKLTLSGLSLLLAVPAAALAAGNGAPAASSAAGGAGMTKATHPSTFSKPLPSFSKADTNNDHQIEWKEAKAAGVPRAIFKQFDYRHKNKLTMTEWKLVQIAMLHTASLPTTGPKSLPSVPASVAKAVHAPNYGTVASSAVSGKKKSSGKKKPAKTAAPAPSTH